MPKHTLTDTDKQALVALLRDLVQIPSVNTDRASKPPEDDMARYVAEYCNKLGMHVERLIMPADRPNVLASWPGQEQGKRLVLTAHMDTVGIDGMADPFAAKIRDGKMFGRGACDTKGAAAVYLWTLAKIGRLGLDLPWRIDFLGVCDEETGCNGSHWLTEQGVTADYMIVGEPTECHVATCHRGRHIVKLAVPGKAAHASLPHEGVNAIYRINDILNVLRRDWMPTLDRTRHDRLGPATVAVTIVRGGVRDNIIPDRCELVMDARTVPGNDGRTFIDSLRAHVEPCARANGFEVTIETPNVRPALDTDPSSPLVVGLLDARKRFGLPADPTALPFLTDASTFAKTGAACIVFGPGNIAQAHGINEYLELDQLFLAAEILLEFFAHRAKR